MARQYATRTPQASLARVQKALVRGHPHMLKDVDQRTAPMKRLTQLVRMHESDLGGADEISEAERRLINRAAMITLQLEMFDSKFLQLGHMAAGPDFETYQRGTNTLRRLLETLGLKRRSRDVTNLQSYLASKEADQVDED